MFILFPVICISSGRVFHRLPGRLYHRPLYRQLLPSEASTRATTTAPTGQAGQPGRRKSGRGVGGVPAAVGLLGIWTGIVRTADRRARIALALWCWRAGAFYVLAHGGDNAGQCCRWVRKGSVEAHLFWSEVWFTAPISECAESVEVLLVGFGGMESVGWLIALY